MKSESEIDRINSVDSEHIKYIVKEYVRTTL